MACQVYLDFLEERESLVVRYMSRQCLTLYVGSQLARVFIVYIVVKDYRKVSFLF